ncbi:spore germination protein [Paenibacillus terricola]|nr:spore germination protein [Paenibacillus terricola]
MANSSGSSGNVSSSSGGNTANMSSSNKGSNTGNDSSNAGNDPNNANPNNANNARNVGSSRKSNHASNEPWTEERLQGIFKRYSDVNFQSYQLDEQGNSRVLLLMAEGLSDSSMIGKFVLPGLVDMYHEGILSESNKKTQWTGDLPMTPIQRSATPEEVVETVFRGGLLILIPAIQLLFALDLADPPKRVPSESNTEISIKGPRDGFVEEITTNVALIRKRVKSDSLCYETFILGTRTKTRVGLLYFDDLLNPAILKEVRKRLQQINIDGLYSVGQLEEMISDYKFSVLPLMDYTGRPDYALSSLLAGRFVLLIDGNPMVLIGPSTLSLLLKSPEDIHFNFFYVSFTRSIRLISLLITLLLPGIWVALMAFHQDQIPFRMMATISVSRLGLPLSPQMEFFILLLLLEIFREAGVRLPNPIGQTLTVVGGLVIGDAAIRAGLVSPSVVVVGAITAVSGATLVNQTLSTTVSIIRLFIFVLGGILGMYGVILGIILFAAYTSRLHSFGVPFMTPYSPLRIKELLAAFLRVPWKYIAKRPSSLEPTDPDHQPETSS